MSQKEFQILGVKLDNLDPRSALEKLVEFAESTSVHQVATVNPEFLVEANSDFTFKAILNKTTLNLIDGAGIVFWGKLLEKSKRIFRTPGVDLVYKLALETEKQGLKIFLLGGEPGVAQRAADKLLGLFPKLKIVGVDSGGIITDLKIEENLKKKIIKARPQILLVAFGHPKQEKWIATNKDVLNIPLMMGMGGTFDFISGKIPRAPLFLRKLGLEWLYRLYREPKRILRIWKAIFVFSYLVLREELLKTKNTNV